MKMKRSFNDTGIVLVTVLFLTILISMFIGAAILVGPRTLGLADSEDGALTASAAAESGMQYALMRIRENPDWRGDGGGTVVSSKDFTVVENSGYVWGSMRATDGSSSMFRIRFNYENGSGGQDKLDDSNGPKAKTPFVSVNNLSNTNSAIVPRASSDSTSSVKDHTVGNYEVPAYGICLIVEGFAGPSVRDFDPAQPDPTGFAQTKILEGTFVASNLSDIAKDAAAMSNGNLVAKVDDSEGFTVEAKGGGSPSVRSRGDVSVSRPDGSLGKYNSEGTVYSGNGTLQADYDTGKTTVDVEDQTNPFYELTWDELKTADASGPSLAAGTYVWWDNGSLHYYEMEYEDYASWVKNPINTANPGKVIFASGSYASGFTPPSSLNISAKKISITGDLYVAPVSDGAGGTKATGIAVIPREGAAEQPPNLLATSAAAAGPALAQHLANNEVARTKFFSDRLGDSSPRYTLGYDRGWNSDGGGPEADITWSTDGSQVNFSLNDYASLQAALESAFSQPLLISAAEVADYAINFGIIDDNGDLDLGTGDTTTAEDLELKFEPKIGQSATLSAEGNVRFGTKLKGQGASITSGGSLKVIGAGTEISALANTEDGVNMYAKGDITLSTLKEKNGKYEFKDITLKGLVYTWGDFTAKLGTDDANFKKGTLNLEGTLVAFGGDPANGIPTSKGKGKIEITAKNVFLKFDPAYLLGVMKTLPNNIEFIRTAWTSYK